jgi:hypothetical protein
MDARHFLLEQYDCVRTIVDDMVLRDLGDDQLRHSPVAPPCSPTRRKWEQTVVRRRLKTA